MGGGMGRVWRAGRAICLVAVALVLVLLPGAAAVPVLTQVGNSVPSGLQPSPNQALFLTNTIALTLRNAPTAAYYLTYTINGATPVRHNTGTYSTDQTVVLADLEDGEYAVEFTSYDAGDAVLNTLAYSFKVDTRPVRVSLEGDGFPRYIGVASFPVTLAVDRLQDSWATVTFMCWANITDIWGPCGTCTGGVGTNCTYTNTFHPGALPEGWVEFKMRATYAPLNTLPTYTTNEVAVVAIKDVTAPVINVDSQPAARSATTKATFEWECADANGCSTKCKLDGAKLHDEHHEKGWTTCKSPVVVKVASNRTHVFEIKATDRAGQSTTEMITFYVDQQGPSALFTESTTLENGVCPHCVLEIDSDAALPTYMQTSVGRYGMLKGSWTVNNALQNDVLLATNAREGTVRFSCDQYN
eukprot:jgi/Chlat1/4186/Chrsp27S04239